MSELPIPGDNGPFFQFSSLKHGDRIGIVESSVAEPISITADLFQLSALGATIDVTGSWPTPVASPLIGWRHITTQGRDEYVKLTYLGWIYPLGHRATLITVAKRILTPDPIDGTAYATAYLQYYSQIHVTQRVVEYPLQGQPYGLGAWPFSSATLLTVATPDIDQPPLYQEFQLLSSPSTDAFPQAFFPSINGVPFQWNVSLVDGAGTVVPLQIPLAFMFDGSEVPPGGQATYTVNQFDPNSSGLASIATAYNALGQNDAPSGLVSGAVPGTHVRFAGEVTTGGPGLTTHPTHGITLGAATAATVPTVTPNAPAGSSQYVAPVTPTVTESTLAGASQPAFYPTLLQARVRLHAAETLSRTQYTDGAGTGVGIFLYGPYIQNGFTTPSGSSQSTPLMSLPTAPVDPTGTTNQGGVYAGLVSTPPLNFPTDMVGALGNPNAAMSGLSAAAGVIGGTLNQYAENAQALVSEYLGAFANSQLLGGLTLSDILSAFSLAGGAGGLARRRAPRKDGELPIDLGVPQISQQVADDGTVTVTYSMEATLTPYPSSTPVFAPVTAGAPYGSGNFTLTAVLTISPSGQETYEIEGVMDGFTITVLGDAADQVISIPFGASDGSTPGATFTSSSGAKSNVQVNVGQPTFLGALAFIGSLEQFLSDIGGSGVSINVGPTQISTSISLALPSVGCGVFNLENLALSASVVIPFLGGSTVATFGFCSADQPFALTVMCFGGGGYCLVGLSLNHLQSLTASLDFEGQLALDLGVASGGVSAMAGITFAYVEGSGSTLTGFVRITGEVEVLGILSISLELQLMLSYSDPVATGTATMTVSVSLCCFSVSVPITVQKSFGGGSSSHALRRVRGAALASPKEDATNPFASTSTTLFEDQMSPTDWANYCSAFAG